MSGSACQRTSHVGRVLAARLIIRADVGIRPYKAPFHTALVGDDAYIVPYSLSKCPPYGRNDRFFDTMKKGLPMGKPFLRSLFQSLIIAV